MASTDQTNRLSDIYARIAECPVVTRRDNSDDSLKEFEALLAEATPRDDELCWFYDIRVMYKSDRRLARKLWRSAGLNYLILWLDAVDILKHFGIIDLVFLKLNDGQFVAEKRRRSAQPRSDEKRHSDHSDAPPLPPRNRD